MILYVGTREIMKEKQLKMILYVGTREIMKGRQLKMTVIRRD